MNELIEQIELSAEGSEGGDSPFQSGEFGPIISSGLNLSKIMEVFILGGYLAALLMVCVGGIITFNRLVHLERECYPAAWERDGKPWHGSFGEPGGSAWKQCSVAWLFVTAYWMREDKRAFRLLMIYRGLGAAFAAGLFCGVLYRVL